MTNLINKIKNPFTYTIKRLQGPVAEKFSTEIKILIFSITALSFFSIIFTLFTPFIFFGLCFLIGNLKSKKETEDFHQHHLLNFQHNLEAILSDFFECTNNKITPEQLATLNTAFSESSRLYQEDGSEPIQQNEEGAEVNKSRRLFKSTNKISPTTFDSALVQTFHKNPGVNENLYYGPFKIAYTVHHSGECTYYYLTFSFNQELANENYSWQDKKCSMTWNTKEYNQQWLHYFKYLKDEDLTESMNSLATYLKKSEKSLVIKASDSELSFEDVKTRYNVYAEEVQLTITFEANNS